MSTELAQQPAPQPAPHLGAPQPRPVPAKASAGKTVRRVVFWSLILGVPLFIFFLASAGLSNLLGSSSGALIEKNYSKRLWTSGRNKIAIIHLDGTIMSSDGFIKKQIEQVTDDDAVKGVVFRINSPGGLVTASDHIYKQLLKMRDERGKGGEKLPMVVSMGGMAASGGYYVAMAVGDTPDSIYAEPTTWTGSIGVIIPHYDLSGLLEEKLKVKEDAIGSHRLKGMGSIGRKMTDEERKIFKGLVDNSFDKFKKIVKQGRPKLTDEQLNNLATGQVFHIDDALSNGLVDQEGYVEDAISGVIKIAGLDEKQVRVVEYEKQATLVDLLTAKAQQPNSEIAALVELAKPQAFFLMPGWPPVELKSFEQ